MAQIYVTIRGPEIPTTDGNYTSQQDNRPHTNAMSLMPGLVISTAIFTNFEKVEIPSCEKCLFNAHSKY